MLFCRKLDIAAFGPRPVNHSDVLVRFIDAMDVQKARRDECAGAGFGRGRTFAEQFNIKAALLFRLAQRGDLRVFIQFDVPAERQPFVQFAMMDEQNLPVVNDEDRNGEINFFVDMGHAVNRSGVSAERRNSFDVLAALCRDAATQVQ